MKKFLLAMAAAAIVMGCSNDSPTTGANETSGSSTTTTSANDTNVMDSGAVNRNIDQYAGQSVTVKDEIDGVYGPRMYKLGDDLLLILANDMTLRDDEEVIVTGTIERSGSASTELMAAPEGERENLGRMHVLRATTVTRD